MKQKPDCRRDSAEFREFFLENLREVPYLTAENAEKVFADSLVEPEFFDPGEYSSYFSRLEACVGMIQEKYREIVTGLWFIAVPSVDGGTQFFCRTKAGTLTAREANRLSADIFDFTGHEMSYSITNDDISNLLSIPIEEWLEEGRIYAVFDEEK